MKAGWNQGKQASGCHRKEMCNNNFNNRKRYNEYTFLNFNPFVIIRHSLKYRL